jgi:hypothetical protein
MSSNLVILRGRSTDNETRIAIAPVIYRTKNMVLHRVFGEVRDNPKSLVRSYTISWTNGDEIARPEDFYDVNLKQLKRVVNILQGFNIDYDLPMIRVLKDENINILKGALKESKQDISLKRYQPLYLALEGKSAQRN